MWEGGDDDLKDFRPISLVGSLRKLLAKVLPYKLKEVVGEVIFYFQNAFVKGRQILEAILFLLPMKTLTPGCGFDGLRCKPGIEKAYYHIHWNLLSSIFDKMGFAHKRIWWE